MVNTPKNQARCLTEIYFDSIDGVDFGHKYKSIEFKAMVNSGYIVKIVISDPYFNTLTRLIEAGYLEKSRTKVLKVRFRIRASSEKTDDKDLATKFQIANIISLRARGGAADMGELEFIGIDPPSWELNTGDGSGSIFKGSVSEAIGQVIQEYAPNLDFEIDKTNDSKEGKWAMMRQDPQTFITSLLDWSCSLTENKTQWIVTPFGGEKFEDRPKITIKEQASIRSKKRAYYTYWATGGHDTIKDWTFLSNNALSITQTKIITQGLSSISGQYLDRATDKNESIVFAKDSNTEAKYIAKVKSNRATSKPNDNVGSGPLENIGWTSIPSIPEFNAGDLGIKYEDYINGRPRGMYLNLVNSLIRMKLTVIGHGEWSDATGLGTDTVFLEWLGHKSDDEGLNPYFLNGNWLVYGFNHKGSRKGWYTDLYIARYDYDSVGTKIGVG